jgi:hypothetical protein
VLNRYAILILLAVVFLATHKLLAAEICIPTPECNAVVEAESEGNSLVVPGYSKIGSPGDPALPFKDIFLLLPPNADPNIASLNIRGSTDQLLPGQYNISPAPPVVTVVDGKEVREWGEGKQIENGKNMLVYSKNEFFPRANLQFIDVGNMRNWRIARVRYYPYRYNPVTRQLIFTSGGEVVLPYRTTSSLAAVNQEVPDSLFADKIAALTSNYAQASQWYSTSTTQQPNRTASQLASTTITNYLILTTSAVVSGSTKLQAFINHKINRGFSVGLATEAQWGGGTGDVAAERIRSYLKANYITKGIRYVLLIGNPDPSVGDVPMKMLWPRRSSSIYREAPSDYYYADLTGNWDLDGDGFYGEGDHDLHYGGVDRYPEVIVGRIPFYGNFADLDYILQKIIDYEAGGRGGPWVRNILLTMKPSDTYTPGYHLGEAIKNAVAVPAGFSTTRVYEQTYNLNPPPDFTPCTYDTVSAAAQQHAGFWFWWTHGNETVAADVMTSTRTQTLDDRYPVFTFQCSCLNGTPENPNNLGYSLLKRGAVATNSATRVSWYYPGQVDFTNTDSNAGMTYRYAIKLVRDHKPCGDAHFEMMVEVPLDIWMNHCVFNLYGDPSLAYASGPTIQHVPYKDTDVTTKPYTIEAQVTANAPLNPTGLVIRWNTDGGTTFNSSTMSLVSGSTYRGTIPAQPYGTTVYYYIYVQDQYGQTAMSPSAAPTELHSFKIRVDTQPPLIEHTPVSNTGDVIGPYPIRARVTDNTGIQSVAIYYHRNNGSDTMLPMQPIGDDQYEAQIPGPSNPGDTISYYILAIDAALGHNTARDPSPSGYYTFAVPPKRQIAVYNSSTVPPYFLGSNTNAYQKIKEILDTDPAQRFQVNIVTTLTPSDLAGQDALVLPDNAVSTADLSSVANWFVRGKTILTLDSSTCYAAWTGFLWPQAVGTNGYGTCWDTNASQNDQEIVLADPITAGYTLGQVIDSRGYTAAFIVSALPFDAQVLARSQYNPSRAYAVYRDVPGRGRIIALGPYIPLQPNQYSMIREALAISNTDRIIRLTSPAAGTNFEAGSTIRITFQVSGGWQPSDRVKIEYTTGLDSTWRPVPGAESLAYNAASFNWNTEGLPGSHGYKLRISHVGGTVSTTSESPFTIVPVVDIIRAKSTPDGYLVKLSGKVVTSSGIIGFSYVQEPGRPAGIRVQAAQPLTLGATTNLIGTMKTIDGERVLEVETAQSIGAASQVRPLFMRTCDLGGSAFGMQRGVSEYRKVKSGNAWMVTLLPVAGLNNIGVLVKVHGTVAAVGNGYFYIDDGAQCNDGSGNVGVRVICGNLPKPPIGTHLSITGVSSSYYDRGEIWRAIIIPDQTYMQVMQ